MKSKIYCQTSLGLIGIADDRHSITNLWFQKERAPDEAVENETDLLVEASEQLSDYLSGSRKEFTIPLAPTGTPFMMKVWESLLAIPYGQTRSYGEIARYVGSPGSSRAVGMANNRNPISIFIPCHRVIGANGKLVGYLGGLDIKEKLLQLERQGRTSKSMD